METPGGTETPSSDIDLGGGGEPDPFDHIPPDPLSGEELPPGVEHGSLPGHNPSEGQPAPEEEEFPEDPDQREAGPGEEEYEQPEASAEEEAEAEAEAAEEGPAEPETDVAGPPAAEEPEAPAPEEKPSTEKRKRGSRKSKPKKEVTHAGTRGYIILREGSEPGNWTEAFEREDPEQPYVLQARNGTSALRKAFRLLSEQEDEPHGTFQLVSVPEKLWNLKTVSGRVHKQTAISIA